MATGRGDALLARQWQPSILLKNVTAAAAPSATMALHMALPGGATRPAHGATVALHTEAGTGPRMAETVPGGEGHSGKSAPELTFGLGAFPAETALVADITWRDGDGAHRARLPVGPGRHDILLADGAASLVSRLHAATEEQ